MHFLQFSLFLTVLNIISTAGISILYPLEEENPKGFPVGNVASDSGLKDKLSLDEFENLEFSVLNEGNPNAVLFAIDKVTGRLVTNTIVDRESVCETQDECIVSLEIAVYMTDPSSGLLDLYQIITCRVLIKDVNDNEPSFSKNTFTPTVPENVVSGFFIPLGAAVDNDKGQNSELSYELVPDDGMFTLKNVTNLDGSEDVGLIVNYPLDRETRDLFQVQIIVRDRGDPQLTGSVLVNITVTDMNDNAPVFTNRTYSVDIIENRPLDTLILQVSATDLDIGLNGNISYHFNSRVPKKTRNIFALDQYTGDITAIGEIDYEAVKTYQFVIEARDKGNPVKFTQALVKVNTFDQNDNVPIISINLPPSGKEISESANPGYFVAYVMVSDMDSGDNGLVSCQISNSNFRLLQYNSYSNKYKVELKQQLDYEASTTQNVSIMCEDHGNPTRISQERFTISVKDENDNTPTFLKSIYTFNITENNRIGDGIIDVRAIDLDPSHSPNGHISYSLLSDGMGKFNINSQTGRITARQVFDRETKSEHRFHVRAIDHGVPRKSSAATVIVRILDENDIAPKFNSSHFIFYVLENQPYGTYIGNLTAYDKDIGLNGQFSFSFLSESEVSRLFSLEPLSGKIKTAQKLDREKRKQYDFTAVVMDHASKPLSSKCNVTIFVLDDNDFIPKIEYPNNFNNTVALPYTTPSGTIIAQVRAYDADDNEQNRLLYSIEDGNTASLFVLDHITGTLRTSKKMHIYEADTYKLLIAVRDNGSPQRTSYANFNIVVSVGNTTSIPMRQEQEGEHSNLLVIVTIIVVTLVIAIAIVATILIIINIDKSRKRNREGLVISKIDDNQFTTALRRDSFTSSKDSVSNENENGDLSKKKKKEVSFQDDTDSIDKSSLTNVTSFSTFKNSPSYLSSIDQKTLENPKAHSSLIANSTFSPDSKSIAFQDKQEEINRLAFHHSRRSLIQRQQGDRLWLHPVAEESKYTKTEDSSSDTSAGTAGTSDSGRGGSEEDINGSKGPNHSSDSTDSDDSKFLHCYHTNSGCSLPRSNFSKSPNNYLCHRPEVPCRDDYRRNISFSDDSVTANTTVDRGPVAKKPRQYSSNCSPVRHSQGSMSSLQTFGSSSQSPNDSFFNGRTMSPSVIASNTPSSTPGLMYSVADIEDDDMCNSSVTEVKDNDDASTTTSGSYTINPEELCNEIDDLFFRDVIV